MYRQYPWDDDRLEQDTITGGSGEEIARTFCIYDGGDEWKASFTTTHDAVYIEFDSRGFYIGKEQFLKIAHGLEAEDKQPGDVEVESDIKVGDFSLKCAYPYPPKSEYQITVNTGQSVDGAVEDALRASKRYGHPVPKADSISSTRSPRRTAVAEDIQEAMNILERAKKNCEELRRSL